MPQDQDEIVRAFQALLAKKKSEPTTLQEQYGIIVRLNGQILSLKTVFPTKPLSPDPSDCCGSGCTPCVYDSFNQDLQEYQMICQDIQNELQVRLDKIKQHGGQPVSSSENEWIFDIPIGSKISRDLLQDYFKVFGPEPVNGTREPALDPKEYRPFCITSIQRLTDTSKHSMIIQGSISPDSRGTQRRWELQVGQHVQIQLMDSNSTRMARYMTPTTHPHSFGTWRLHIRLYDDNMFSQAIARLQVGDNLLVRGPLGNKTYSPGQFNSVLLLAAGSGITHLYQVMLSIEARQPIYPTQTLLIYTASTTKEFWLKEELLSISQRSSGSIRVVFWESGITGRLMPQDILELVVNPFDMALICGPSSFESDMSQILTDLKLAKHIQTSS